MFEIQPKSPIKFIYILSTLFSCLGQRSSVQCSAKVRIERQIKQRRCRVRQRKRDEEKRRSRYHEIRLNVLRNESELKNSTNAKPKEQIHDPSVQIFPGVADPYSSGCPLALPFSYFRETLEGSFSDASTPIFANKYYQIVEISMTIVSAFFEIHKFYTFSQNNE